ncbi:helix-turn-helix domain-containing protein [[Clostridium] colinum]|uniref:helix-turn-helix domain-containing protein n=1 Tax=[Clostridium] colinum TaxID=36835 RepID=UPI00202508C7|nr:helix-turn-helix transcriptional regulator [[Clostridium] colinum]
MTKNDLIQLSSRIKSRRKSLAYTQEDIAEKLGLSYSHYSKIENAISFPSLDTLIKISKIFGLSLDNHVFGEKNNTNLDFTKLNNIINDLKNNKSQKISDLKTFIKLLEVIDNV